MPKKRFTEGQIVYALKQAESGTPVKEVCRKIGVTETTFYTWRKKYGRMDASEAKRLRALEAENAKLKRIVADQMLDMTAMKELLAKNW